MPDKAFAEYPKALRPPSFSADALLVKQPDGSHAENQLAGRYAQVIVNDKEEEEKVLASWGKSAPKPAIKV